MYNRYIPQPDGSFRRSAVPDRQQQSRPRQPERPVYPPTPAPPPPEPAPAPPPTKPERCPHREKQGPVHGSSVGSFLKQLLPKDFDTSDLIIVLLLLLMAGDCPEEQNNALLTLALYLVM